MGGYFEFVWPHSYSKKRIQHKIRNCRIKKQGEEPEYWHLTVLDIDVPEVSSSEIREKLENGVDVSHLLP